jgi:hypothetical protein
LDEVLRDEIKSKCHFIKTAQSAQNKNKKINNFDNLTFDVVIEITITVSLNN